ncbi:hypothetical protein SALBM311S_10823 [Streptomyces alboniger]
MVVDDQHSDANDETPFPKLLKSRGYLKVRRMVTERGYDTWG